MALRNCPDCKSPVSDAAPACPKCGRPQKKRANRGNAGCLVVIIIGVIWFVATLSDRDSGEDRSSSPAKIDDAARELGWTERGTDEVRAKLKDPGSAQFRGVFFHRGADNVPMTCGEVNSKNAMSGYSGYQRFISAGRADLTCLEAGRRLRCDLASDVRALSRAEACFPGGAVPTASPAIHRDASIMMRNSASWERWALRTPKAERLGRRTLVARPSARSETSQAIENRFRLEARRVVGVDVG